MSLRKIIFLAISGIILIVLIITIIVISSKKEVQVDVPKELKIWINEGTTDDYLPIIEGFKKYAPEFAKTNIVFEKKTTDPVRYRTLLLSMMSDNMSPDIFMIGAGEDSILKSRIEPIPEKYIDIGFFEKEYDDIFMPLITSTGSEKTFSRSLLGVPMGSETMGIFYNKSLVRTVPKTWDELEQIHQKGIINDIFVSNLGLGPKYTQNASDVLGLFFVLNDINSIVNSSTIDKNALAQYMAFKDMKTTISDSENQDIYSPIITLEGQKDRLEETKTTTLDMFVEGKIGMIFGFPSIIGELEKSDKRIGGTKSNAGLILTAKVPLKSITESRKNIAHYNYFAVSKGTKNPRASVKFLEYLLTSDAQRVFLEKNPHLIAAQRSFWPAQKANKISSVFSRVGIDTFIPEIDEELSIFDYGLKTEFTNFLSEYLDRSDIMDISNIINLLSTEIRCSIAPYDTQIKDTESCEKK